jgi:hypothetical protein
MGSCRVTFRFFIFVSVTTVEDAINTSTVIRYGCRSKVADTTMATIRSRPNRRMHDEEGGASETNETELLVPSGHDDNKFSVSEANASKISSFTGGSITWKDSLYKNDKDVIAVFDIDYKKMAKIGRCKRDAMFVGVLGGSFVMFVIALSDNAWDLNFLLWIPVAILAWLAMHYNTFVFQMLRRHIAIASRGVYIDDVDEPGSSRLVRRQVIALDAIEGCHVIVVGGCRPTYQAVIRVKVDHGLFAMVKEHVIPGLIEARTL